MNIEESIAGVKPERVKSFEWFSCQSIPIEAIEIGIDNTDNFKFFLLIGKKKIKEDSSTSYRSSFSKFSEKSSDSNSNFNSFVFIGKKMKKYMKVAATSQDILNKDASFITSNISNSSKASESVQSSLQSKKKLCQGKFSFLWW